MIGIKSIILTPLAKIFELGVRMWAFIATWLWARKQARAYMAEKTHESDKEASRIRARVGTDADYRERVRREFDGD
jgi:hypothetical protein